MWRLLYKKLFVEEIDKDEEKKVNELKCMACPYIGENKKDLDSHVTTNHVYQLADPKERERRGVNA